MADPASYSPFPGLPPAPVQQQPWAAPRGFDTDQLQQQQQQQRIPLQNPNYSQMRQYTYGRLYDPLGPMEYKNFFDDTNMEDPLTRYQDLEELDGITDPRVLEYHNADACGPDARGEGDLTSNFAESLVRNGIFCRFTDYRQFDENNKATREDISRIIRSRQRACRCAVKRRFAMALYKKKGEPTFTHELPLKTAEETCAVCGQMERELRRWGHLKHLSSLVADKHEALKKLTLAVHELLTDDKDKYRWASYQGATDFDKICLYVWNEVVKHDSLLHMLRKAMPFEDFKELLKSIDAIAKADKHSFERKKALTLKAKKLAHLNHLQRYRKLLLDQEQLKLHLVKERVGHRAKSSRSRSSRSRTKTGKLSRSRK